MTRKHVEYEVTAFPRVRQPIIDALRQARRMNVIHLLLEADVTDARQWIREFRERTGNPLSLTTFVTFCLACAVAENRSVHAYRSRGKLIAYDDVDIAVDIEREFAGQKTPIYPCVIKAANRKSLAEIRDEISTAKAQNLDTSQYRRLANLYWYAPGFLRSLLWRIWLGSPYWRKRLTGTVGISAVGMFGKGTGWGIPISTFTLSITVGTIAERPALVNGQLQVREYLSLTASFDHDIVDGAPAVRFTQRFKELVETGHGLHE